MSGAFHISQLNGRRLYMNFKRILLLSHEMTYTGAPNSLLNIAKLLRRKGNFVTVGTQKSGDFIREYHRNGFRVFYVDPDSYCYDNLADKYDLVIANTIFCGKFAIEAQKKVPTVLYIREAHNLPDIIRDCGLSDDYITNAKNIICVSEYSEEFIRKTYDVQNLYVLHNFLNLPLFYYPKKNVITNNKIHFLIAGTIEKRKGYDIVLSAIDLLPTEIVERTIFHIAGRKPEWSRDYWDNLDFDKYSNVIYHGEITSKYEMSKIYNQVNVVIVPSIDESCSLTALEGAMHKRLLILSKNVGAKYILENKSMIFSTGSPESLAEIINKVVLFDDSVFDKTGEKIYKKFLETSTPKMYYSNFKKIISEVIENGY